MVDLIEVSTSALRLPDDSIYYGQDMGGGMDGDMAGGGGRRRGMAGGMVGDKCDPIMGCKMSMDATFNMHRGSVKA